MKYGEILDYRTKDKAVVGKEYVFSDILYSIINSPQDCSVNILGIVKEDARFPFGIGYNLGFQFAREIIEEEPKYRPYKDTDEMISDWKKRFVAKDWPSHSMPLIWLMCGETRSFVTDYLPDFVYTFSTGLTMQDIYEDYTYLDGSPCGMKED